MPARASIENRNETGIVPGIFLALALHAAVLLGIPAASPRRATADVSGNQIEVSLAEGAPGDPAPAAIAAADADDTDAPEDIAKMPPIAPTATPAQLQTPASISSPAPAATPHSAPSAAATPLATRKAPPHAGSHRRVHPAAVAPPSSPKASAGGAGATGKTGVRAGSGGAGKLSRGPTYLVRPEAEYPTESRAAGEQGLVMLSIQVGPGGRPTSVTVAQSSGYPRLDLAAVEGAWRCRVAGLAAGAVFQAPVRFNLKQ